MLIHYPPEIELTPPRSLQEEVEMLFNPILSQNFLIVSYIPWIFLVIPEEFCLKNALSPSEASSNKDRANNADLFFRLATSIVPDFLFSFRALSFQFNIHEETQLEEYLAGIVHTSWGLCSRAETSEASSKSQADYESTTFFSYCDQYFYEHINISIHTSKIWAYLWITVTSFLYFYRSFYEHDVWHLSC